MDITQNANFQAWFKGSVAVGTGKEPLRLYHGTSERFTVFDTSSNEGGAFFTTNREAAEDYGDIVLAVYLRICRPVTVTALEWAEGRVLDKDEAIAKGFDGYLIEDHDISGAEGEDTIYSAVGDTWVAFHPEQIKAVKNRGRFDPANPDIFE